MLANGRIHSGASLAQVKDAILVLTCLPFISTPASTSFCFVLEILYDLANNIAACNEWDLATLNSKLARAIPLAELNTSAAPFVKAQQADVTIPPE